MGFSLIIQTILVCLISGLTSKTFWFSYILFLIFIGGILILFIYISSLSSNEKISFSLNTFKKIIIPFIFLIFLIIFKDKFYLRNLNNSETNNLNDFIFLINENYLNLTKLYDTPNNIITIILVIYLLLSLIVVVKITNSFIGPLRQKT